jgi:PTH1 family peptidyl-tRNA hydrolase
MENQRKFLIAGLGNAENKYAGTRHNIGFEVVTALAKTLDVSFNTGRHAYIARGRYKGRDLLLIMPTTYMNLSGKAVRYWMDIEHIVAENVLIIADDIDLQVGQLRLRGKGSGGTHNGLNHIIETLGHVNFPRLRFGIGKNYPQGFQIDYVLSRFDSNEWREKIVPGIDKAVQTILSFVSVGLQRTMEICNRKEDPVLPK